MSDLINKDAVSRAGLLKSWEELSPRGRLEFDQVIMTIPALPSAVCDDCIWHGCNYNKVDWDTPSAEATRMNKGKDAKVVVIDASAEAEPTVIRSKTLMPTQDFKEWAKRVREVNPNAVVIPCDAEVASAEAAQGEWIRKEKEDEHCAYFWYECDQCGSRPPRNEFTKQEWLSNFCPNCGAKMKDGDD